MRDLFPSKLHSMLYFVAKKTTDIFLLLTGSKNKKPPYLSDGGVIEVDPLVKLGVVDEGGVVFAVVADDGRQVEPR